MSEKVYHFGFGVNADYVKYAGILMTNLTELHPERRLCFHFACDGIEAGDQKRLAAFARRYRNVKIKIYRDFLALHKKNINFAIKIGYLL